MNADRNVIYYYFYSFLPYHNAYLDDDEKNSQYRINSGSSVAFCSMGTCFFLLGDEIICNHGFESLRKGNNSTQIRPLGVRL